MLPKTIKKVVACAFIWKKKKTTNKQHFEIPTEKVLKSGKESLLTFDQYVAYFYAVLINQRNIK